MTIATYRKKPVVVQAVQWTGENADELVAWTGGRFRTVAPGAGAGPDITAEVYDELHATWVGVKTGQSVLCGVQGEFYPIDEAVLAETYEPVNADV